MPFACVHVPGIAVQAARRERFGAGELDAVVATYRRSGERRLIVDVSAAAAEVGVRPGMTVSAAEGNYADLVPIEDDPVRTRGALEALADALFAFGPVVATRLRLAGGEDVAFQETVLIDVTRVHGTAVTTLALTQAARAVGFAARAAIASSPWAALVLAGDGRVPEEARAPITASHAARTIERLPVASARLPDSVRAALDLVGIRTIGAFLALPVAGIARRFGQVAAGIWRALRGTAVPTLIPYQPREVVIERLRLDDGAAEALEALGIGIQAVTDRVVQRLVGRGLGAEALELTLDIEPGLEVGDPWLSGIATSLPTPRAHVIELDLGEAHRDPVFLREMLLSRLQTLPPPGPVTAITLTVQRMSASQPRQLGLFDDPEPRETIAATVARLAAVVGDDRFIPVLAEDFRPERAWTLRALPTPGELPRAPVALPLGERPTRLFREPQPIPAPCESLAQPPEGAVAGPERLVSGWWDEAPMARDYWVIADRWGRRSWIFRDLATSRWYRHGIFD